MSKAFTRESDDLPETPIVARAASALPPGAKNYLTASGDRRLREELSRLIDERPRLIDGGSERHSRPLQSVEQRIADLQQSLATAEVVLPPDEPADRVTFGATVTVRERDGEEMTYRIVGVDETDLDRGWVSWLSPIARALVNARLGEQVRFKFPSGEKVLGIVGINYE